jgi:hypothetical protein
MQQLQQLQQAAMLAQQRGGQATPSAVSRVPLVTQQAVLAQAQAQARAQAQLQAAQQSQVVNPAGDAPTNQTSPTPGTSTSISGTSSTPQGVNGASGSPVMPLSHGATQASPPNQAQLMRAQQVHQQQQQLAAAGLGTVPGFDLAGNVIMAPEALAHQARVVSEMCTALRTIGS